MSQKAKEGILAPTKEDCATEDKNKGFFTFLKTLVDTLLNKKRGIPKSFFRQTELVQSNIIYIQAESHIKYETKYRCFDTEITPELFPSFLRVLLAKTIFKNIEIEKDPDYDYDDPFNYFDSSIRIRTNNDYTMYTYKLIFVPEYDKKGKVINWVIKYKFVSKNSVEKNRY